MKKTGMLFCSLLLVFSIIVGGGMSTSASAEEASPSDEQTQLLAQVPGEHTVTVEGPGGKIAADNVFCGTSFSAQRHSEVVYTVIPNPGKRLVKLSYNGTDVTAQVKNGTFTAPKLVRDAVLSAVYEDAEQPPDMRSYDLSLTVLWENGAEGTPAEAVNVSIGSVSKEMDSHGKGNPYSVSSGVHQIIVTDRDGKLLGHLELTISSAQGETLVLDRDVYGNPIITPAEKTEKLDLTLWLTEDGKLIVKDGGARDITPVPIPNIPKTGDRSAMALWVVVFAVSLCSVMVLNRKRNTGYVK